MVNASCKSGGCSAFLGIDELACSIIPVVSATEMVVVADLITFYHEPGISPSKNNITHNDAY